jgi:uncharacterized protein
MDFGARRDRLARSTPSAERTLLVFVRAPVAGTVKTRLARDIGEPAALAVYRRLVERTLGAARAIARDGIRVRVHHAPSDAGDEVRAWIGPGPDLLPQGDGDLGERMARAFDGAFRDGATRVVIVGSDLPDVSPGLIRRAFRGLEERPAVLGPALDGGYYLLGLRAPAARLFTGVPWGTGRVLQVTLERLRREGRDPVLLEPLRDVDRAGDLPPGWTPAGYVPSEPRQRNVE